MLDCVPFITAVENHILPYKQQELDIFKSFFIKRGGKTTDDETHREGKVFLFVSQNDTQIFITLCVTKLLEISA